MIAYLDLPSGLSGDMFLGCLVDAGWPIDDLRRTLAALALPAEHWSVEARPVMKGALRATHVQVRTGHEHAHRHLKHIRQIIEGAPELPADVKTRAVAVFTRLAQAEARVHNTTVEKVHFHEVGALDAIIDIVGVVAGLRALGIERLHASAPAAGEGLADTEHGRIPVPAPATVELLAQVQAPLRPNPQPGPVGELLTPTGAALLAELATFSQPAMTLARVGVGAGTRDCAWPNVARLLLGEPLAGGQLLQLETNLDDMNPQLLPVVMEQVLAAGAKDAWLTPVQMKKGRPGVVLSVLAPQAAEAAIVAILLKQTTTLGVRVLPVTHRHEAGREMRPVTTPFGDVRVKVKLLGGQAVAASPEYEDCRALAEARGVPVREVYDAALVAGREAIGGRG